MTVFLTMDLSVLSLIILLIIYFNIYSRSNRKSIPDRLFSLLIISNMLLIVIDILGWAFNGLPGDINRSLNIGSNALLYLVTPAAPILWALYTYYQIHKDEIYLKRAAYMLAVLFVLNAAASLASVSTGWFFTVDASNIYQRGQFFWAHLACCYSIFLATFFYILINKKRLEKRYFISLLLFFVPMSIGTALQVIQYGVSYNWVGMMLSLLIIYFYIQNRGLNTDYLTGAYNRRQFDGYAKAKIRNSTQDHPFAAIMMDIDDFKQINDTYGHETGDEVLKDAVMIIKQSLRQHDFVARIGGDEFIVILNLNSQRDLEQTVKRIQQSVHMFNLVNKKPYRISFSFGYDIYNKNKMNLDGFLRHIDHLMYKNKNAKRMVTAQSQSDLEFDILA